MADPVEKTQVSIRVPTDIIEAFDDVAKALERDRTWVMVRALRRYLDDEGADILREAKGIAALDRGEGVDFDRVMDEADAVIARATAKHAKKVG
jgi:predicted transcriptional regulator